MRGKVGSEQYTGPSYPYLKRKGKKPLWDKCAWLKTTASRSLIPIPVISNLGRISGGSLANRLSPQSSKTLLSCVDNNIAERPTSANPPRVIILASAGESANLDLKILSPTSL
jgi:hypothetical protein